MIQNILLATLNSETANGTKTTRVKLTTTTDPKLPKKLGLGQVYKTYTQIVEVGGDYYNHIDERLDARGISANVAKEGLPWGQWSMYPFFIEHKGETYLRVYQVERCVSNQVTYIVNGHNATEEELETIRAYKATRAKSFSHKQSEVGLNEIVQVRPLCYKLETIDSIEFEDGTKIVKG